ncbi:ATP-dependent helicase [Pseudomonas fragi]|uniref:DNA 3'-5' helicase n=4 Tax=Pseudomonas TaxID=286 RepID=A0A0X8ETV8_PSEFR|nr:MULTISPECIES: ATP-dependent helicase [Pseudomonas]AMB78137.1 ATP-dependent DNA helicase [Pseudomonas fragi]EPJ95074.1 putative DNA helicase, DNA helicase UvrD/REP type domain [Pseudomonas psychrophila]MBW0234364.1 ATP-dependent DNA helicase [Pseudomonas sp. D1HM]MDA7021586.1 ATP-dependent helicase [Pseudomonas fragi]MEC4237785.1 ATP-dependent helicase [Pseudomonas sp. DSV-1]
MFAWDSRELNAEQSAAIEEPSSVFLIACPGSGKTRTLTYKIAYELSRATDKRIVVAITYTHRAADEIQERIEGLGVDTSKLWIGTIHSFCLEWIIKPYGIYLPELSRGYRVLDRHDRELMLDRLCAPYPKITHWDCDYYFSKTGYHLGCKDAWKHETLHKILGEYFRELGEARQIDFELILWYAQVLMSDQKHIASILASVFSYVLVDEYQDTKQIQYGLLTAILRAGAGRTKTFIVGDPNQAIYGSLGGYAVPVADFRAEAGIPIREMALTRNYRSSNRIISHFSNFSVYPTSIESAGSDASFPSKVSYNQHVTLTNLHDELVRLIQASLAAGHPPEEICVLAPWWILLASTTRHLVRMLPDQQFDGPGLVPFSNDIDNFWFKVSKIILTESSPKMLVRRMRWARDVISDLGDLGVDTSRLTQRLLLRECNSISISEMDGIAYLDQAFTALLERLGVALHSFPALMEHRDAFFRSSLSRIDRLQKDGAPYINDISFFRKVFRERTGITVSTIHGVKGAEYDVVIAFGLLQGMVPHFTEAASLDAANKLLYVVGSRARKNLHLISESGRPQGHYGHYAATEALFTCVFDYDAAE